MSPDCLRRSLHGHGRPVGVSAGRCDDLTEHVRLLEQRTFDPPRPVEVEHNGRWWPGSQTAWRLCDDSRGWMAQVTWTEQHEWGLGKYMPMVPPERIRAVQP